MDGSAPPPCLRPAGREQCGAAAYLPAYQGIIDGIPGPAVEDYTDRIRKRDVYVAKLNSGDGGEPCPAGVLVVETAADQHSLMIYSIAVAPPFQGRTLGRQLLAYAERVASDRQLAELRLYTNVRMQRNIALYRSCGYAEVGRRPHSVRPGEVLIDMAKAVAVQVQVQQSEAGQ